MVKNRVAEYSCGGVIPEAFVRDYVETLIDQADAYPIRDPRRLERLTQVRAICDLFHVWRELWGPRPGGHYVRTAPLPRVGPSGPRGVVAKRGKRRKRPEYLRKMDDLGQGY